MAKSAKMYPQSSAWIPTRNALTMISILSAALAVFTMIQVVPVDGFWIALLWGAGSAAGLWIVFLTTWLINRLLHRRT